MPSSHPPDLRDLAGHTCIVTGATSGIGRATAQALGALQANLILIGRNEVAGRDAVCRLGRQYPHASFDFIRADLSRQGDVRRLASSITRSYDRIDVLLNNAGARFDNYYQTEDGIELTFATNYLGHFLLTCLVLDLLVRAPAGRVITVASGSHAGGTAQRDGFPGPANYDRRLAYATSKLANVMFAYELARRLRNTRATSNAADPGGVASRFARNNGLISWLRHIVAHGLKGELVSPRTGAEVLVYLAASNSVQGITGKYFHRNREVKSSGASYDEESARDLWNRSLEWARL